MGEASRRFGYGYQFWPGAAGEKSFAMTGIHGQTLRVIPSAQVVVVQTAAWANASDSEASAKRSTALNAVLSS